MMNKKIILTAISALVFWANGFSQDMDSVKKDVTNTPWYFTIGLDFKVRSIYGNLYDSYTGEGYFNQHYYWMQNITTNKKFLEGNKSYFPKLDLMISKWRNFRFGMSYNTGIIRVNPSGNNEVDYLYLAINGIAEYQYNFNKVKPYEGGFIYTSLAAGPYRSSENLEGPGREFFAQIRLGGGYEYKGFMAKAFISSDNLYYREKTNSPVFNKMQEVKTNLNMVYFGIGVSKEFRFMPDVVSKW